MNSVPDEPHRRYSSPHRERQVEQTREIILEALAKQLVQAPISEFNIPDVARRAGVSVRTIYRYFPTKDALLDGFIEWNNRQLDFELPKTPEQIVELAQRIFPMFDQNAAVTIAQWVTKQGWELRQRGRRHRLKAYRSALQSEFTHLPEVETKAAVAVVSHLLSSSAWKSFREEFDMTGEESGKAVAWALRALINSLREQNQEAKCSALAAPVRKEETS